MHPWAKIGGGIAILSIPALALADTGNHQSEYEIVNAVGGGSGTGAGTWEVNRTEDGWVKILIEDTGDQKTTFTNTRVTSEVALEYDPNTATWVGTTKALECTNNGGFVNGCNFVTIGEEVDLYEINVFLDEDDNTGTVSQKSDAEALGAVTTTTVTYTFTP
ncbi:Uncharacterised protein [BD1-7 clade bacterium]|uniref:Uncharacterized protein n=1 Tax=BD1-7 clade bacterium TaxID=2029982 RepID=A0A5S9PD98_9GAMM|nr:Uncharacterised protein [BD1-7 clade bacterium]